MPDASMPCGLWIKKNISVPEAKRIYRKPFLLHQLQQKHLMVQSRENDRTEKLLAEVQTARIMPMYEKYLPDKLDARDAY